MASVFASCSLLLLALLFLLCGYGTSTRITINQQENYVKKEADNSQEVTDIRPKINKADMNPSYNVWFTPKDLYKGFTMPIYLAKSDPSNSPHLLTREESDSIPFSISQLDYLLSLFSISKDTPQAKAIAYTLNSCDMELKGHEIKSCVSSQESLLDLVQKAFGSNTKVDLFTSITHPSETSPLLQKYSFLEVPQQITTRKMLACHPMPYPYAIFYCHGHVDGSTRVFKIPLGGENGDKVDAIAVCHSNTSSWDEDHISFKMLNMKPRSGPVCHIIPRNNFVWLPSIPDQ
ncbi:BURP domain-containing protein [Heracleum sosnowskyi]|uniref:BURP domain-containing protein n=1 Tax=Heracleum sosnowskyi TaxID=360622 RepID=A0AAD8JED4_9APIA|nr:BURP domain-containing protein [Heracleum sosnowskyi]